MSNYSENLVRRMRKQGYNQALLAEKVGCSPSAISNYCRGKNVPTLEIAQKIDVVLGADEMFITVEEAASKMHVSEDFIREGLKSKTLPIGWEVNGEYYISPKLFEQYIGD